MILISRVPTILMLTCSVAGINPSTLERKRARSYWGWRSDNVDDHEGPLVCPFVCSLLTYLLAYLMAYVLT